MYVLISKSSQFCTGILLLWLSRLLIYWCIYKNFLLLFCCVTLVKKLSYMRKAGKLLTPVLTDCRGAISGFVTALWSTILGLAWSSIFSKMTQFRYMQNPDTGHHIKKYPFSLVTIQTQQIFIHYSDHLLISSHSTVYLQGLLRNSI